MSRETLLSFCGCCLGLAEGVPKNVLVGLALRDLHLSVENVRRSLWWLEPLPAERVLLFFGTRKVRTDLSNCIILTNYRLLKCDGGSLVSEARLAAITSVVHVRKVPLRWDKVIVTIAQSLPRPAADSLEISLRSATDGDGFSEPTHPDEEESFGIYEGAVAAAVAATIRRVIEHNNRSEIPLALRATFRPAAPDTGASGPRRLSDAQLVAASTCTDACTRAVGVARGVEIDDRVLRAVGGSPGGESAMAAGVDAAAPPAPEDEPSSACRGRAAVLERTSEDRSTCSDSSVTGASSGFETVGEPCEDASAGASGAAGADASGFLDDCDRGADSDWCDLAEFLQAEGAGAYDAEVLGSATADTPNEQSLCDRDRGPSGLSGSERGGRAAENDHEDDALPSGWGVDGVLSGSDRAALAAAAVVIVGGGPVGLWTALQIAVSDPAIIVVVLEARAAYTRHHGLLVHVSSFAKAAGMPWDCAAEPTAFDRADVAKVLAPLKPLWAVLTEVPPARRRVPVSTAVLERALADGLRAAPSVNIIRARVTCIHRLAAHLPRVRIFVAADGKSSSAGLAALQGAHPAAQQVRDRQLPPVRTSEVLFYQIQVKFEAEGVARALPRDVVLALCSDLNLLCIEFLGGTYARAAPAEPQRTSSATSGRAVEPPAAVLCRAVAPADSQGPRQTAGSTAVPQRVTPVSLFIRIAATDHARIAAAQRGSVRTPLDVACGADRALLGPLLAEAVTVWLAARQDLCGDVVAAPPAISLLKHEVYTTTTVARVFPRERASAGALCVRGTAGDAGDAGGILPRLRDPYIVAVVGDSAFGVPFQRALNNGFLCGSAAAECILAVTGSCAGRSCDLADSQGTPRSNPAGEVRAAGVAADRYAAFVQRLAAAELQDARGRAGQFKLGQMLLRWVPRPIAGSAAGSAVWSTATGVPRNPTSVGATGISSDTLERYRCGFPRAPRDSVVSLCLRSAIESLDSAHHAASTIPGLHLVAKQLRSVFEGPLTRVYERL